MVPPDRTTLQRQYRPDGKNGQEGNPLLRHPWGPHVDEFEALTKSGRLPNESFHRSRRSWDRRSRNRPGGFFGDLNGGLQWEVQSADFGRNGLIPRAVVSINTDCPSTRDTTSEGTVFQQLTGSPFVRLVTFTTAGMHVLHDVYAQARAGIAHELQKFLAIL